jgi:hypothetical protein
MENAQVAYKSFLLTPLAAYDETMYAAMQIVRYVTVPSAQRKCWGAFPSRAAQARRVAASPIGVECKA